MAYARRSFAGAAAVTTITADLNGTATSITIASSTGWPTGSGGPFYAVIAPDTGSEEKILVNTRSGTTLTLSSSSDRGVDGGAAFTHTAGDTIYHTFAGVDADEANYTVAQTVGKVLAKGDFLIGSGTNTLVRLPVGSNGQWPVADSSAPSGYSLQNLPDGAVTTAAKLASNVVTTAKILDANVTAAKLAANAVTTAAITDANVTAAKMATNSVATASIVDDAVTAAKLADGAIDATAKFGTGVIPSTAYVAGSVGATALASNAVTTVKITDANVTTAKLADDSVTAAKLDPALGRGYVTAPVTLISDSANITTAADIVSITWTADPDRTYRIVGQTEVFATATTDNLALLQIVDASNIQTGRALTDIAFSLSNPRTMRVEAIESGLTGSTTRKLRITRNSGTGGIIARGVTGAPKYITVEDMGAL